MSDPLLQHFLQLQSQPVQLQHGQPQPVQQLQQGQPQQGQPQQGQPQQGQLQQGQSQQLHHLYPQALFSSPSQQLQLLHQQLLSQPSQLPSLLQASQALQLQQRQHQHQQPQQQGQPLQQQQEQLQQQPPIINQLNASDLPQLSHIEAGFQNQQENQPSYAPSVLNMDVECDTTPQGTTARVSDHTDRAETTTDERSSRLIREIVEQVEKTFRGLKKEMSDGLEKQLQNYNNKRQDTLDDLAGDVVRLNRSFARLLGDVAHIQNDVTSTSFQVHALFEFGQKIVHDPTYASIFEQLSQSNRRSQSGAGGADQ